MFAPIRPTPTKPIFIGFKCRMSNAECRWNIEPRITKRSPARAYVIESFELVSEFVIRASALFTKLAGKEWIISLLLADARHRSVTRTNDRFIRECENF